MNGILIMMNGRFGKQIFRFTHVQMHQDDDPVWYRAAGGCRCQICGLTYREHPLYDEQTMHGKPVDHRLCNGDVVHL